MDTGRVLLQHACVELVATFHVGAHEHRRFLSCIHQQLNGFRNHRVQTSATADRRDRPHLLREAFDFADGVAIRRVAAQNNTTMLTSLDTVRMLLDVLEEVTLGVSTIDAK